MTNYNDEIDPIKVRTGLFALITARLEDAHEVAVKGQSGKAIGEEVDRYIGDLRGLLDEIYTQIDAIQLIA